MRPIAGLLRRVRPGSSGGDGLSRIDRPSPQALAAIPDADFVSSRFDRESAGPPLRMVVLLSTPRSGSTYLCQLLHRAGHCTMHEYFQREHYLPLLAQRWACVDDRIIRWDRYASALEQNRTSAAGVLGINLHGSHLARYLEALPHFVAPQVDYVWLTRRDKLRQAVSYGIARQTRQWSSAFEKAGEATYDYAFFLDKLQLIHRQENAIASFLHLGGIACRQICYEDFVQEPMRILREAFGVDTGEAGEVEPGLRKQGDTLNESLMRRFARDLLADAGVRLPPEAGTGGD